MLGYLMETTVEFLSERLPAILLGTLIFAGARRLLIRRGKLRRRSVPHEAAVVVFACYAAVVLSLTFLPLPFWRFMFHPSPSHYDFNSTLLAMLRGEQEPPEGQGQEGQGQHHGGIAGKYDHDCFMGG